MVSFKALKEISTTSHTVLRISGGGGGGGGGVKGYIEREIMQK